MTATVQFTTDTGFIYTVGFEAAQSTSDDETLIKAARPFAAREWRAKISASAEVDPVANGNRAYESIMNADATVLR
ncbi:hypothetical protein [Novosphingobium sp. FKTRR1]|uniref:hypothetical protein n=1 Tax=Novosphingobium sp. FKTRR1 TaxID=2879118 RepID=UPI001CF05068|nr:hypothetical protein [Novosphingobium sp. FKTRR1]